MTKSDEMVKLAEGVIGYRSGSCRNDEGGLDHTYAMMEDGELRPMCGYGWNRSDGTRYSILRGPPGTQGDCKLCAKNVAAGKPPVMDGWPHKTISILPIAPTRTPPEQTVPRFAPTCTAQTVIVCGPCGYETGGIAGVWRVSGRAL